MKMLVIGMDGVDANDFNRGWTPFISSLLDRGQHIPLKEDLITRGWSEIILGGNARTTGAFYDRPAGEGRFEWTDSFRIVDVPGLGRDVKPIWQVLNERGSRVGIMNVPTTFPAAAVEGFFVSGGGGGGAVTQDVNPEQCYPTEVRGELQRSGYILDERLGSLLFEKQLKQPDEFFDRLSEMASRRTSAFIELAGMHSIDFGLLVYRATMVAETVIKPALSSNTSEQRGQEMEFAAESFYRNLDKNVKRLVEAFPGSEFVFVSDHGTALREYSVNFNSFLRQYEYQKLKKTGRALYQFFSIARHWIPRSLKARLKKKQAIARSYASVTPIDLGSALAFNNTRRNEIHGIFVNDEIRFGGPVKVTEISGIASQIVAQINSDPISISHGISAYCNEDLGAHFSRSYPDVIVELPDGYLPSNDADSYVEAYGITGEPWNLGAMRGDEKHCIKSHQPLCVTTNLNANVSGVSTKKNLGWLYDYILIRLEG